MNDDRDIERYLLGEMDEADEATWDADALADDVLARRIAAVEDALIDASARGELPPARRARLETRLAASARGRERLAFARILAGVADRPAAGVAPAAPASPSPARWRPLLWAALIALAFGAGWWVLRAPQSADDRVVVVLAAAVRSDSVPAITVPASARTVVLEIDVEGTSLGRADRLRLDLHGPDGIRALGHVPVRRIGGLPGITQTIPATALPAGRYRLQVTARGEGDEDGADSLTFPFDIVASPRP